MEPTLYDGDWILLWKTAYSLHFFNYFYIPYASIAKNDIVFYYIDDRPVIKRCVAKAESPLDFSAYSKYTNPTEYALRINKKKIVLSACEYQHLGGRNFQPKVPHGMILALGDNLEFSHDSRAYGFVSEDSIYGKILWK